MTEAERQELAQQVSDYIAQPQPQQGAAMMMPAPRVSGGRYSPDGAREAYETLGHMPVLHQGTPGATAAWRTFQGPNGQLGVQPLLGFNSPYAHVIQYPGDNPFRAMGLLDAFVGSMWRNLPPPTIVPMRGGMGVGGGALRGGGNPSGQPAGNTTAPGAQDQTPAAPGSPQPVPYRGQERVNANYERLGLDYPWNYYPQTGVAPPRVISGIPAGAPSGNPQFDLAYEEATEWDTAEKTAQQRAAENAVALQQQGIDYMAAMQQQSPAVMRAAQDFIQQPIALTELAGPLDVMHAAQQVPQRLQLPPVSPSLYDVVNTPSGAVLQAAGYR